MPLLSKKPKPKRPHLATRLYQECTKVSNQGRKYLYGGDHAKNLHNVGIHDPMDCSSSTAYVLMLAGMFDLPFAQNSAWFAKSWGRPGKGKWFTVWANDDHVWIQFHGIGRWWRFDTSPHGWGTSGPRMRRTPRFTNSFRSRHWPGL